MTTYFTRAIHGADKCGPYTVVGVYKNSLSGPWVMATKRYYGFESNPSVLAFKEAAAFIADSHAADGTDFTIVFSVARIKS